MDGVLLTESADKYIREEAFSDNSYWIWGEDEDDDSWWMFRKVFEAPREFKAGTLLITAATQYIAYVNGLMICRGPGRSYDFSKCYDVVDITHLLLPGKENVIAVLASSFKSAGIISEVKIHSHYTEGICIPADSSWRIRRHPSFKPGMPHAAISGREEYFDSRVEPVGWTDIDFDSSEWDFAREIGKVGTAPWTEMERCITGPLTNDPVFPVRFHAIEMADMRPGYRYRLSSTHQCAKVFMTEIFSDQPVEVSILFNDSHSLSSRPKVSLNGSNFNPGEKIPLKAGVNLLCCCQVSIWFSELELLIETKGHLKLSAGRLLRGVEVEWAVYEMPSVTINYPWHEPASGITGRAQGVETFAPEVIDILAARNNSEFPNKVLEKLLPAVQMEPSIFHIVSNQYFFRVTGGFTDPVIAKGHRRDDAGSCYHKPLINQNNMLHKNSSTCTVLSQPGKDVHFIVGFENEQIGYVQIKLEAPEGTILDVQCFEVIDGGGIAWMPNYNGFRYICREGLQTFTSHSSRGFRYISVTMRNFDRLVSISSICCMSARYPVEKTGCFECSDARLNRIYDMSVETASLCMLDTYVDCPGHEQNFWVGDARITAIVNMNTFGAYDLNQRSIRLVGQSLSPEWVKAYWPGDERYTSGRYLPIAAFPNYPEGGLPMWSLLWIIQCWEHYLYGADMDDLTENYRYVRETLKRFRLLTNKRGLFDMWGAWNLIEWGNNDLTPYGEVTANNVLLVTCLRVAACMARCLKHEDEAGEYDAAAASLIQSINQYCWNTELNAYVDTVRDRWAYEKYLEEYKGTEPVSWDIFRNYSRISEQSNTLALLCDCVPTERVEAVKKVTGRIEKGQYIYGAPAGRSAGSPSQEEAPEGIVAIGSPFFLFFSLGLLFKEGRKKLALDVIRRDWGNMAEKGTGTCWETFQMDDTHWTRSVCHAWSAAPAVYLPSEVLGVKPVKPGYSEFTITPYTEELSWAKGTVVTPYGPIFVHWWKSSDGKVEVQWTAPKECKRII